MKKIWSVLILLIIVLIVAGCGSENKFIGKYQRADVVTDEFKYDLIEITKPDKSFLLTRFKPPFMPFVFKQQGLTIEKIPATFNKKDELLEVSNGIELMRLKLVEEGKDKMLLISNGKYRKISDQKFNELKAEGEAYFLEITKDRGKRRDPKA